MHNEEGESIDRAPNPMMILTMPVAQPVKPGDMIRNVTRKKLIYPCFKHLRIQNSRKVLHLFSVEKGSLNKGFD